MLLQFIGLSILSTCISFKFGMLYGFAFGGIYIMVMGLMSELLGYLNRNEVDVLDL